MEYVQLGALGEGTAEWGLHLALSLGSPQPPRLARPGPELWCPPCDAPGGSKLSLKGTPGPLHSR